MRSLLSLCYLLYGKSQSSAAAVVELVESFLSGQLLATNIQSDELSPVVLLLQYCQKFQLHYLLVKYSKVSHLCGVVETVSMFLIYSLFKGRA